MTGEVEAKGVAGSAFGDFGTTPACGYAHPGRIVIENTIGLVTARRSVGIDIAKNEKRVRTIQGEANGFAAFD